MKKTALKRSLMALAGVCLSLGAEAAAYAEEGEASLAEAAGYMKTWEDKGKALCEANDPGCAAAGNALFKAAAAYQAGKERNKAIAVRRMILDPRWHLDYTDYGKETAFDLAYDYQSIAEYALAAELYEAAAKKYPNHSRASTGLTDAVVFRIGLGEQEKAVEDAELFKKNYGARQPGEVAMIDFALALDQVEKENWSAAKKALEAGMAQVDRGGTLDVKVRAHAALGQTLQKLGDDKGAEKEYEIARSLWKNPQAAVKELMSIAGPAGDQERRLGKALTAVGEAVFFFGEKKRKETDAIRFPYYKGKSDQESISKFISTKVKDWMGKKREAIEATEKEYLKILELQPVPPPRWVIASGARIGQLWAKFAAEFRAAPIPREWKSDNPIAGTTMTFKELRKYYFDAIDSASEPLKQRATASFKVCRDYSVKYQWFDDYVRSCHVWLSKNYSKEFVIVDEIIPKMRPAPLHVEPALSLESEKK